MAPAVLAYLWTLHDVRGIGWALAMLFATCCALRLARFNTELEVPDRPRWTHHFFTGIPAPAAAGLALTPMIMSFAFGDGWPRSWLLNAVMLVFVAFMMVSRVPTFSIKRIRVKPEMVLPTLLVASVIIVGLVVESWLTLSVIGMLYLCSIPFGVLSARRMKRRETTAVDAAMAEPEASSTGAGGEPWARASNARGEAHPAEPRRFGPLMLDARLRRHIDPPLDRAGNGWRRVASGRMR